MMDVMTRLKNTLFKTKVCPMRPEKLEDNVFYKFCDETSLPGWPYLIREMNTVWKIIWIVFLVAACGTSVYVLVKIIFKMLKSSSGYTC